MAKLSKNWKTFIVSLIVALSLFKLMWDSWIVMQGQWYAPIIYFALVGAVYMLFREGLKW